MKLSQLLWSLVLFAALLAALMTSWSVHRYMDYGYGFWYDHLELGEHINEFGPRNRYIRGLETLDRDDHLALFSGIVEGIHHQGQGLEQLSFTDGYGVKKQLLREPEIVHLNDVARLVDLLSIIGSCSLLFAFAGAWLLARRRISINTLGQAKIFAGLLLMIVAILAFVGPKDVFYQLHVWIFPDDHQWFFYYQDSLMSTMMKAPDLFGGIAATIAGLGVILFAVFVWVLLRLTRQKGA